MGLRKIPQLQTKKSLKKEKSQTNITIASSNSFRSDESTQPREISEQNLVQHHKNKKIKQNSHIFGNSSEIQSSSFETQWIPEKPTKMEFSPYLTTIDGANGENIKRKRASDYFDEDG